jgi:hypothetical protein
MMAPDSPGPPDAQIRPGPLHVFAVAFTRRAARFVTAVGLFMRLTLLPG